VKVKEVIRLIEKDGWYHKETKGSHRQYKHSTKSGRVTIPGNMNHDLHPKTLKSILKQANIIL